eukprot:gene39192-51604_t
MVARRGNLVEGAEPTDLQSVPFNHSGTPPAKVEAISFVAAMVSGGPVAGVLMVPKGDPVNRKPHGVAARLRCTTARDCGCAGRGGKGMAKSLRVGIAGLGTVGANVVRLVKERAEAIEASTGCRVSVTAVSARDPSRDRGIDLAGITWFDDPVALARSPEVDCVVELIGGADGAALAVVESALSLARPVVTANKALLAKHGLALA